MKFRIGHGIDIHAFEAGDHVVLGGVKVPHNKGIKAHSDGDIILHAVTDALLGALGMGDLGQWFPDNDPEFKDIQSKDIIMPIIMSMRGNGFVLNNLDVTVIAQAPKVSDFTDEIRENIASIFNADLSQINIKATTNEMLGAIGRKEGICAHAVISLIGKTNPKEELSTEIADTGEQKIHEINIRDLRDDDENAIDLSQEVDIRDFNFDDDLV